MKTRRQVLNMRKTDGVGESGYQLKNLEMGNHYILVMPAREKETNAERETLEEVCVR